MKYYLCIFNLEFFPSLKMNLFGKKKAAAPTPSPLESITKLRETLNVLEKREEFVQKKIDTVLAEAKVKAQKSDKKGALFALKKKKLYEEEITKLQGTKLTLETQIMALESATINVETLNAMKNATGTMKALHGNIDADAVDDLMADLQEERDIHNAISEAISRPGMEMFDDEELNAELAELEALEEEEVAAPVASKQPASNQTVFNFPSVPNKSVQGKSVIATEESEDERALRELEASML